MSAFSYMSDSSSSSAPPITPDAPHSSLLSSSPSTTSLATPPDSLRQYQSALKARMRLGMQTAMAELKDEGREPERQFDVEFGYDDEDPIERHVKLFLTPHKAQGRKAAADRKKLEAGVDEDEDMSDEEEAEILVLDSPMGEGSNRFQPGLIHFRRSARPAVPVSRSDSGASTPRSTRSEASFQAVKSEDYVSMYGGPGVRDDRLSTVSTSTISSTTTMKPPLGSRPSLLRPRPRAHPYPEGGRLRELSGEMGRSPSGGAGAGGGIEESEEESMAGRTISETMVAKAGYRCQRGRTARR